MIRSDALMLNQQGHIKERIIHSAVIRGAIIAFLTCVCAIVSSMFGWELLSIWPVFVLILIFIKYYELGLICFALSFAYQGPVVFAPSFGLSAVIRLDELVFASIFPIWLMRISLRQSIINSNAPLKNPLLLYVVIAFLSLLVRYDTINSTPFLNTATGFKGLVPLMYKLTEVVGGYFMLTDVGLTERTRADLFSSLLVVAAISVLLNLCIVVGILPANFIVTSFYDPHYWYTRFALFGNTSAWGVLLTCYFFILLYTFNIAKSLKKKGCLLILMSACVYGVLISGTKTAAIGIVIGLMFFLARNLKTSTLSIKTGIAVIVIIPVSVWSLNYFATWEQKRDVWRNLEKGYIATGIGGYDSLYYDTSLGSRIDHFFRFFEGVKEDPQLLVLGHGWQRRAVYKTGISLHNDLLTALHDLGILGGVFVVWIYFAMFRQFRVAKTGRPHVPEKVRLLSSIMQVIAILLIASSFTGENLTLYWGIDVVFPFIIMLMAITWTHLDECTHRKSNA